MNKSNRAFAAELIGTHVLAGLTYVDHAGKVIRQTQFHGKVIRASVHDGVTLVDAKGEEHWLPLDRESFEVADPGEYCLRSTGEVVIDPTWLTTWTLSPPERH